MKNRSVLCVKMKRLRCDSCRRRIWMVGVHSWEGSRTQTKEIDELVELHGTHSGINVVSDENHQTRNCCEWTRQTDTRIISFVEARIWWLSRDSFADKDRTIPAISCHIISFPLWGSICPFQGDIALQLSTISILWIEQTILQLQEWIQMVWLWNGCSL